VGDAAHIQDIARLIPTSLIPVMGLCYMMQYMDKLALSQATLFNLREDLVRCTSATPNALPYTSDFYSIRASKARITRGHRPSSILDTWPGAGPAAI
jgi:hypothetical protein